MEKELKKEKSIVYITPRCAVHTLNFNSCILAGSTKISDLDEYQHNFDFIENEL